MEFKDFEQLSAEIDATVFPNRSAGKTTAGELNALLKSMAAQISARNAESGTYEEVIRFVNQTTFTDTVFEPCTLIKLVKTADIDLVELSLPTINGGAFFQLLAAPADVTAPALTLPVGKLTYRITYAEGVSYAALKQIIQLS